MGQLVEQPSDGGPQLLRECSWVQCALVEKKEAPGKVYFKGKFGQVDKATENKRYYPRKIIEREIKGHTDTIKDRGLYGELDHPTDTRMLLQRSSHIITRLDVTEDGDVMGEAEVLPTPAGDVLAALVKANCRIGVSSRGFGSTKPTKEGMDEVQDDFRLVTYDVVADPAAGGSYPKAYYESLDAWKRSAETMAEENKNQTSDDIEARVAQARAEGAAEAEKNLKTKFTEQLQAALPKLKEDVRKEIRSELLSDPAVAGAKIALDTIKATLRPFVMPEDVETTLRGRDQTESELHSALAAKDAEIAKLKEDRDKLAKVAKEAGYRLHLEHLLANDPQADLIRPLIADVLVFESLKDLDTKVTEIRASLKARMEREEAEKAKFAAEEKARTAEITQLKEQNEKLQVALQKTAGLAKQLAVKIHAEGKISASNSSQAERARAMVESAKPQSVSEVDKLLGDMLQDGDRPSDSNVRARVSRLVRGGRGPSVQSEESDVAAQPARSPDYNGLGVPLEELRVLGGVESDA